MTLEIFCRLNPSYRSLYAWVYGNLLTFQVESDYTYSLYRLEEFYVEVVYNEITKKIELVEGFKDTDLLPDHIEKYLRCNL